MTVKYTPMLEQYLEVKRQHVDEILFFRLGDFYEMFFEDAKLASRELEITLTARDGGQTEKIPMCGIPYHSADNYVAKLIQKGFKVAICEQVEDPKQVKGIVRREVVRIITPGTVISDSLLPDNGNNFLVAVCEEDGVLAFAAADISTGEFTWTVLTGPYRTSGLCDHLFRLLPREIIFTSKLEEWKELESFLTNRLSGCTQTTLTALEPARLAELNRQHFSKELIPAQEVAIQAIGSLLYYLHNTVKSDLSHMNRLTRYESGDHLVIDATALRNLEITRNIREGGKKDTLLSVLDYTKTAMGGRLLKKWLEYPLVERNAIRQRQDALAELIGKSVLRQRLQACLADIYDLERILTRVEVGTANARDLVALKTSLLALPAIKEELQGTESSLLANAYLKLDTHSETANLLENAIVDAPPFSVREGGMIKSGYDLELDELHAISRDTKQFIQDIESREREQTGIRSLKVGYNKVFGYYIEITHANAASAPASYIRKQTLANAERYITPELKEFETKILGAQDKIVNLEYALFISLREHVKAELQAIQRTAQELAVLDVLQSMAEAAFRNQYIRPTINDQREIIIRDGRHPVVERLLVKERFVPNDTVLDHNENEVILITGPNMAGKSTYMRQVALLVLMAQMGSFIPAREASICPVDRIFTRVGASDDLATGQSTFMVEMNEVAQILKHATHNSLIILDEIGRGTSTFDGMSIARAVIEYLREKIKAKTLFATHYHELTVLEDYSPLIRNYSVAVKERGTEVVFLRRIVPGGADKSYGIHVAQLAGLPKRLTQRAQELLQELEAPGAGEQRETNKRSRDVKPQAAVSLFSSAAIDELLAVDVMTITPLEAMNALYRLQTLARQESGKL
ncbi:DNA mismatch repair protein MutS [Azotosporobacter soli]|uniref:DNA mismatch repair protein MutS n=1 Tax=Azotosporobacter soli TaxID=3055040 RepID=UPI0031FECCC3